MGSGSAGSGFSVQTDSLRALGKEFSQAGSIIKSAAASYNTDAKPTGEPFGMVEGASKQLADEYQGVYGNANAILQTMWNALDEVAGMLMPATQSNYSGSDHASTPGGK
jgi:hypothetical protein